MCLFNVVFVCFVCFGSVFWFVVFDCLCFVNGVFVGCFIFDWCLCIYCGGVGWVCLMC